MARRLLILLAVGIAGAALWRCRHPSPARLRDVLEPRPGERILAVGPGTGAYAPAVAAWIAPGGTIEVLDDRRETLDATLRRAAERGLEGIVATQADPGSLPFEDEGFDAGFLVGKVPDREAALRELRRVVRVGGRIALRRSGGPLGYFALLARD